MLAMLLRPYLAILAARFLMMLQYRAAALAGIVTQFWFGAIMVTGLAAFYASGRGAPPITLEQAITYTWLGQAFLGLLPWNVDPEIAGMMRSGDLAYERLRPVDTYFYWFTRATAWRAAGTLLRSIPLLAITGVLFPALGFGDWALQAPSNFQALMLFTVSMIAVLFLSASITTLLNVSVILTLTDQGLNAITNSLVIILSGMVIPLPLFPDWTHAFLFLQPFAGLVDIPYRIYFADLTGASAVAGITVQVVWTVLLIVAGRVLMARAMSRVQVQGG